MPGKLLELNNVSVTSDGTAVLHNISLTIHKNEQWAIVGASGSGKTTLAKALAGKIFHHGEINSFPSPSGGHHRQIAFVEQQHWFKTRLNTSDFYYQQRFNSTDDADSITVGEALNSFRNNTTTGEEDWPGILHIDQLMKKPLIQLSNGENKRLQLAEALFTNPSLLILDNPYLGLDAEGRAVLHRIISSIAEKDIHIILITSPGEFPQAITHIALLEEGRIAWSGTREAFITPNTGAQKEQLHIKEGLLKKIKAPHEISFRAAVKMNNVNIRYGDKTILRNIYWVVKKGECWSVSGPNGAGKSTLLSIITADNPQAYANDIYLFDKKRGTGESIWDIKRHIGFVSPELHLFFNQGISCFDVIASGLFDTIGLFRPLSEEQIQKVVNWTSLLNLNKFSNKLLHQLSTGQQKMVLLARAMVKNPPLLILDEPCQGLDEAQTLQLKEIIQQLCEAFGTTLIYISHYSSDIPNCVTKFLRLENGAIVGSQPSTR